MDIQELLKQRESAWLDFKRQYHDNRGKLLHDLLCLANSYCECDRYLVFGVDDRRTVCGVQNDEQRMTNANLQDWLRQLPLNRLPTCQIDTHDIESKQVDVLTILNQPVKPFFLTEDYPKNGKVVRNGVVYNRLGDTNTPMNESARDEHVELMWRERFGLGLSPLERARRLLTDPQGWKRMGDGNFYCIDFPEFTIADGETIRDDFQEEWTTAYPDKSARSFEVLLKYHTTVLERYTFVACDGDRYKIPLPTQQGGRYVISRSRTDYKLARIYPQYYPIDHPDTLRGVELVD